MTRRHYGPADVRRLLATLAAPAAEAARVEIGADRAHRVYRRGLRTAATVRRAARQVRAGLRLDAAAALVFLAAVAGRVARQLRRAARRVGPVGPRFRPAPVAVALPPAEVPDLTGGRSFRAVAWEGDGWTDAAPEPTTPVAAGPEPWGVVLPRSRRIVRPVAPPADVPADEPTPVVAVATPEPTPADEYAHAVDPAAVEPTDPPAAPVKPTRKPRARKPAAPKVQTIAARVTTPPAAPTFTSIDQARAALGSSDIKVYGAAMDYINAHVPTPPPPAPVAPPAVSLSDVRPMPLVRFAAQLDKGSRFSGAASARKGWATDSKGAVRVPTADREAIAAKIAAATGRDEGRAPDVETVLPTAIDPRPFVPTARGETESGLPAVLLTREDGETRTVDVRLYRTILHHSPKGAAVYARQTHGRQRDPNGYPLAVFAGDPTTYTRAGASGLLMPLVGHLATPAEAAA